MRERTEGSIPTDGHEGAQRELVGEERHHVSVEELQGLQWKQARIGHGRQRWRELEYVVPLVMARCARGSSGTPAAETARTQTGP